MQPKGNGTGHVRANTTVTIQVLDGHASHERVVHEFRVEFGNDLGKGIVQVLPDRVQSWAMILLKKGVGHRFEFPGQVTKKVMIRGRISKIEAKTPVLPEQTVVASPSPNPRGIHLVDSRPSLSAD